MNHPWKIWLAILLVLAALPGLARLRFDTDVTGILPQDLPEVKGLQVMQREFSRDGELVILLVAENEDDAVLLPELAEGLVEHLDRAGLIRNARWRPMWEEDAAGAAAEWIAWLWLNGDPAELEAWTQRFADEALEESLAESLAAVATAPEGAAMMMRANDPFGFLQHDAVRFLEGMAGDGGFESDDGLAHLILTDAPGNVAGYREAGAWLDAVRGATEQWLGENADGARVDAKFTGGPAFAAEIGGAMERDMRGTAVLTMGLVGLLFWWMQRRLRLLAGLVAMLALVFTTTLGIAGWVMGELSVMTAGFAAILIGLAVDYGVLICQEAKQAPGDAAALRRATTRSILWAAVTTATVFAALHFSALPGIAALGTLVAAGILVGAVLMLVFYLPFVAKAGRLKIAAATIPPNTGKSVGSSHRQCSDNDGTNLAPGSAAWLRPHEQGMRKIRARTDQQAHLALHLSHLLLMRFQRNRATCIRSGTGKLVRSGAGRMQSTTTGWLSGKSSLTVGGVLALGSLGVLAWCGLPETRFDPAMMRPRESPAMDAYVRVQDGFPAAREPDARWIVTFSPGEPASARLAALAAKAAAQGQVATARMPHGWWPEAGRQAANRAAVADAAERAEPMLDAAGEAGFSGEGLALSRAVFREFGVFAAADETLVVPASAAFAELTRGFMSRDADGGGALMVDLALVDGAEAGLELRALNDAGAAVTGWDMLRPALMPLVAADVKRVFVPMLGLMLVMLCVVFRRARDVLAIAMAMGLAGLMVLAAMAALGMGWNILNIAAAPLFLGIGIDYGIHMAMALRRHDGNAAAAWHGTGKAVVFCAASTGIGFGSLCFASNDALASLGAVSVLGIVCAMWTSVFLMPGWRSSIPDRGLKPGEQ